MKFKEIANSVSALIGLTQDPKANEELLDYERANKKHDLDYKKSFLRSRKQYGFLTFALVAFWLVVMLYFVLAQGLGRLPKRESKYSLSEPIVISLITTTTINVLALLIIVLRNLFPSSDNKAPDIKQP